MANISAATAQKESASAVSLLKGLTDDDECLRSQPSHRAPRAARLVSLGCAQPGVSQTTGSVPALPGPVGFVLGGGGGLGAVQVGMLQGLQEAGIRPDFIIGTSVGALNGAVLAAHPSDAHERLSALWHGIKREDAFGNLGSALWTLGRTHTHILKTDSLARMIRNAIEPSLPAARSPGYSHPSKSMTSRWSMVVCWPTSPCPRRKSWAPSAPWCFWTVPLESQPSPPTTSPK